MVRRGEVLRLAGPLRRCLPKGAPNQRATGLAAALILAQTRSGILLDPETGESLTSAAFARRRGLKPRTLLSRSRRIGEEDAFAALRRLGGLGALAGLDLPLGE